MASYTLLGKDLMSLSRRREKEREMRSEAETTHEERAYLVDERHGAPGGGHKIVHRLNVVLRGSAPHLVDLGDPVQWNSCGVHEVAHGHTEVSSFLLGHVERFHDCWALRDDIGEQALRQRRHKQRKHTCASCRLAEDCHPVWVSAKACDVLLNSLKSFHLVKQPKVSVLEVGVGEIAKKAESVVDGHDHHTLGNKSICGILRPSSAHLNHGERKKESHENESAKQVDDDDADSPTSLRESKPSPGGLQ